MTVSTNPTVDISCPVGLVRKMNWLWVKLIPTLRRCSPTAFAIYVYKLTEGESG